MDGFTYEREAIAKWLEDHDTSPKTGATLESKALIPNHSLRAIICDYQQAQAAAEAEQPASAAVLESQAAATSAAGESPGVPAARGGRGAGGRGGRGGRGAGQELA